jgi:hypothetical protein
MHAYKRLGRDRISNGRLFGRGVDLRSSAARRFKYLVNLYSAAFGDDEISEADRNMVRQAAALQVQAEMLQERIVRGEVVNSAELVAAAAGAERLLDIIRARATQQPIESKHQCVTGRSPNPTPQNP